RKGAHDGDTPGKVDISGSADITNLAHNVLVLYRPTHEQIAASRQETGGAIVNKLYIRKNRQMGTVGAIALEFDETRRVFKEAPLVSRA
ncbi:MAG TPA: hypothetical protein VKP88_03370, partial [Candidatus Paceibacterota bacterium]|nr:hypothetical protein [Candidatus Paceibacterota bacterium]